MYSDVVATVAIVVSLATAGWTIYRSLRWERPVVSVRGTQWIGGTNANFGRKYAGFSIDVANTGDHATQIIDGYWELDAGDGTERRFSATNSVESITNSLKLVLQSAKPAPAMPFTLERYQRREWEFQIPVADFERFGRSVKRARPVVEYMTRKRRTKAYGPWEPAQIKIQFELSDTGSDSPS